MARPSANVALLSIVRKFTQLSRCKKLGDLENASNLLAMGGLVHDYMTRTYSTVNSQSLDINTWANVVAQIPDQTISQAVHKTYNNSISGVSVSGEFLSLIASDIITDGASLLTDFTKFLQSIGDVVFNVHTTDESYRPLPALIRVTLWTMVLAGTLTMEQSL